MRDRRIEWNETVQGIGYNELFLPVAQFETVRTLLTLAALEDWEIQALDIKQAFLYEQLDEEIYMEQPEGFITNKTKVWRLRRALYGLKQASLSDNPGGKNAMLPWVN